MDFVVISYIGLHKTAQNVAYSVHVKLPSAGRLESFILIYGSPLLYMFSKFESTNHTRVSRDVSRIITSTRKMN
jgi:hypothetical protein